MMDRRSQHGFPAKRIDITGFLNHCWTEGWFDEYSNDHFLIKAIEDRVSDLEWKTQMISNNSLSIFSPINENGAVDFSQFSQVFVMNISECLSTMSMCFSEEKISAFIQNQLSAGKTHYDENMFFQALSEIEILDFYCSRFPAKSAVYEPRLGVGQANPEASFRAMFPCDQGEDFEIKVNIEVKTPRFPSLDECHDRSAISTVLLTNEGRDKFQQLCESHGVMCVFPRVNKLVEFINSASKKFQEPKENEYNLLYINWSYSDFPSNSFLEAWSLLTNDFNGLLTYREIGPKLHLSEPLNPEAFSKITAIIVYTSSLDQLMFTDFRYVWQGTNPDVGQRFRMFVLDEKLRDAEISCNSKVLFTITGMRPSILEPKSWKLLFNRNRNSNTIDDQLFCRQALDIINEYPLTF